MAAASVRDFSEEATCLDYFKDPVTIECGHSFCRSCLTQCWETSGNSDASCSFCRENVLQRKQTTNWQLANIVGVVKKLNPNYEGGKQEPWKGVYEDYESRISLVDNKEQRDFRVIPLWKGVQDCKNQENAGKKKILGALIQEYSYKIQIIERMEHWIGRKTNVHTRSSLLNAFRGMNKILDELLLDEKSLLQRSEKKKTFEKPGAFSPELKWKIQEFSDKNPNLTTNMKNLALSLPLPGPVVVTAYPACSFLAQSDGRKSVKHGTEPQDLRDNLEKFSNPMYVFRRKGVTTHVYAEGFVKGREGIWPVEVATKSVRGKDHVSIGPKERMWAMGKWIGSYPDISLPCCSVLSLSEKTKEVQGYLKNAAGQMGFLDGEMRTQVDAISEVPLSAVSVQPFFYM